MSRPNSPRRVRVALAGDYPENPPDVVGGIQAVMYYTVEYLQRHDDLDVHVVTCEKWFKGHVAQGATVRDGRLTVHYLPTPRRVPHTLSMRSIDRWSLRRCLAGIDPDVIHAHGQAAAYPLAAFDTGKPVVVTVHGINSHEAEAEARGGRLKAGLRSEIWRRTELSVLRRARDLVIICPWVEQFVRPHTTARLHVIENPVHDSFYQLARHEEPGTILFVGSVIHRKGVLELVQAMARVRERFPAARLEIAGGIAPVYRAYGEQVRQAVAGLHLQDHVRLLGHLAHDDLLAAYARAAVFTLPSWVESSPVALEQAMAVGLPVVTTTIGGTAHLIDDGHNGLRVPPRDPDALAVALIRLLARPTERERFGAAGRRIADLRFTQAAAAMASAALYRALALERLNV